MASRKSKEGEEAVVEEVAEPSIIASDLQETAEKAVKQSPPKLDYTFVKGRCARCGEQVRTNDYNQIFCPILDEQCPRHID